MIPSKEQFQLAIHGKFPRLTPIQASKAAEFAFLLHEENEIQNLTRILGVDAFLGGHLLDVIELFSMNHLGEKVMDLGSGCGVPGLLAAAIDLNGARQWLLVESEANKARFLQEAAQKMNLKSVRVFSARIEEVILDQNPDTVIARAVGTVEKISGWIWKCSTWNNLVLFKSRGWEDEWKESQRSRFGKKLTITQAHDYSSGGEKVRILVSLKRKV